MSANQNNAHDAITLVAPSGQTEEDDYHPNQTAGHVLKKAVQDFGRQRWLDPSLEYVLVFQGVPLDLKLTLGDAGVQPGARLSVRAKDVPGDGRASEPE